MCLCSNYPQLCVCFSRLNRNDLLIRARGDKIITGLRSTSNYCFHFVTLISAPCSEIITQLSLAQGVLRVNGCHRADATKCLTVYPPPNPAVCGTAGPHPNETNEIQTPLRQMAFTLPAAITARQMKACSPPASISRLQLSDNHSYFTYSV